LIAPSKASLLSSSLWRGRFYQIFFALILSTLIGFGLLNLRANLIAHNIPTDFSFWNNISGFDVNQTLIAYSAASTYGEAFLIGLLNTLIVAVIGIFLATLIGFGIGIARLSTNFMVSRLATFYVETLRNIPLLLQLLFFYNVILAPLPAPRQSLQGPFGVFLNNRGLFLPQPIWQPAAKMMALAFLIGLLAAFAFHRFAKQRRLGTGRVTPAWPLILGLIIIPPGLVWFFLGQPMRFVFPELKGFNFNGGLQLRPEFVTLVVSLSLYTASFIAENVRSGITSVSQSQSEAAAALGLNHALVLRLVIIPQALRVIIPPLTSQYLNLIKNSSLAVFIGYPDLVQVFTGTVLNQTGAAVQIILITMAVYLALSLVTSYAMNVFNHRFALAGY
jgi:general L-amino acid transport system permease protein